MLTPPDLNSLLPLKQARPSLPSQVGQEGNGPDTAVKDVAQDFEAAFIAQMLTHSGLAEAMTSGEGKMAGAFGSFYIEKLSEQMAADGGLGLADSIYRQLERYETDGDVS